MNNYSKAGRMLKLWGGLCVALATITLFIIYLPGETPAEENNIISIIFILLLMLGVFTIIVGMFVSTASSWSISSAYIISILSAFLFPIGTVFGLLIIMYLLKAK